MINLRVLTLVGILSGFSASALAQDCVPAISDEHLVSPGKLSLAINPTNPPVQFVDSNGELQGLNVELARELGERLCMEVELVRMDFPGMIPGVTSGRLDGINTALFWTEERSKIMFLVPYASLGASVVVMPGSDAVMNSPDDLVGGATAVETASTALTWLTQFNEQKLAAGEEGVTIRAFPTATNAVSALRAGQVDNALLTDYVARELARRGEVDEALTGIASSLAAMAFAKRPVAEAVVDALNSMVEDGFYHALFEEFGMTPLPEGRSIAIEGPGPA